MYLSRENYVEDEINHHSYTNYRNNTLSPVKKIHNPMSIEEKSQSIIRQSMNNKINNIKIDDEDYMRSIIRQSLNNRQESIPSNNVSSKDEDQMRSIIKKSLYKTQTLTTNDNSVTTNDEKQMRSIIKRSLY